MSEDSLKTYEKLGAFYLGRRHDLDAGRTLDEPILYDAADLTTHALCVGMTGSGKTGLCLSLLEEAAIDGIPALVIDPKGDLGNLMLTFPELRPADFRPWIDEHEAARAGRDPAGQARWVANLWRRGLKDWNQDGARIARLKESADVAIYTPGGTAGLPISVLRSFDPPAGALDADALRDRLQASVSGLLALLNIAADPLKSREHILLSMMLSHAWEAGHGLDLPALIRQIQKPPFDKVGVFDLDSFFPAKDRFELAVTLNNLLASPGFSAWVEGDPLDIGRLLYTPEGRPRIAILSIAHLSDTERMFFVTLLLNEVLSWIRSQPGTSSLRALLYMDEIFGYFPPTAKPPSKQPMLTLLKQARAYGLGVVLATQNPVDLDYKGLSNAGTWFIGRLQTERDKARVLDGLEGASASAGQGFARRDMDAVLSRLGSRVFLMHNVHEDEPVVFHTRWALSYLRGPLTRTQIKDLMADRRQAKQPAAPPSPEPMLAAAPIESEDGDGKRPVLPGRVNEYFLPLNAAIGGRDRLVYRPALTAATRLHYVSVKAKTDTWQNLSALLPLKENEAHWDDASMAVNREMELLDEPEQEAPYSALPSAALASTRYTAWKRDLVNHLYRHRLLELLVCPSLKMYGTPGETEGEFRGRLSHDAREKRDLQTAKLKKQYGKKLSTIKDRIRRAEQRVEKEEDQYSQQKLQTVISMGSTLLGALLGRKTTSYRNMGRATTAARGAGRAARERGDIARAREELEAQQEKLETLEKEFEEAVDTLETTWSPDQLEVETMTVRPRKSDIDVRTFGLAWTPWRVGPDGIAEPVFDSPADT